ncbi:hypothetical protein L227DRAFT_429052 [Lentinus tigrinus ALCF2SS1-6]|uniref:Uncharacterized protein n=1 Tax=Lentinus tigrinus ALCF2SS1-6 TaxID=1328759 RepID=A0A5C2SFY1_9APHY|nr:hypothetical protein L227DRAFT_429052 [Lentinus tigrinus ALCF2SS1-6]
MPVRSRYVPSALCGVCTCAQAAHLLTTVLPARRARLRREAREDPGWLALMPACVHSGAEETAASGQTWEACIHGVRGEANYLLQRRRRSGVRLRLCLRLRAEGSRCYYDATTPPEEAGQVDRCGVR